MTTYFIRRFLLAIPTFIGCTIVVFVIVQLAPGGPLEQQIRQLRVSSAEAGGGGGGMVGTGDDVIPPKAVEELKRYYGFNKPIWERYVMWLGVWPREVNDYTVDMGEARKVGGGKRLMVVKQGDGFKITDPDDPSADVSMWNVGTSTLDDGTVSYYVYQTTFSGIFTGNFGESYQYHEPVLELIKERLPVSIQFGLIGFVITYVVALYLGCVKKR